MRLWLDCRRWLVVGLTVFLVAGCSSSSDGPEDGFTGEGRVDPQILQDVVDGVYWTPGAGVRRGMRVQTFAISIGVQECGGDPIQLDSTEDRPAQNLYPDLELIRERGFAENGPSYRDDLDADCAEIAPDSLTSWDAWRSLETAWDDAALTAQEESPALDNQKASMAKCLRDETGLAVDDEDPTKFLLAVDNADIDGATDQDMMGFAAAYAQCGQPYFDTFASELEDERKDLVERNRETLTRFAVEISDAGYVP